MSDPRRRAAVSKSILEGEREILRAADVIRLTTLSRTTIWRMERRGQFPRSFWLTPTIKGWLKSDVEQWIQERMRKLAGEAGD